MSVLHDCFIYYMALAWKLPPLQMVALLIDKCTRVEHMTFSTDLAIRRKLNELHIC